MIFYIIAALLLCGVPVVLMIGNAEDGYEDESGFHRGKP
jgi:hypothetical protein